MSLVSLAREALKDPLDLWCVLFPKVVVVFLFFGLFFLKKEKEKKEYFVFEECVYLEYFTHIESLPHYLTFVVNINLSDFE